MIMRPKILVLVNYPVCLLFHLSPFLLVISPNDIEKDTQIEQVKDFNNAFKIIYCRINNIVLSEDLMKQSRISSRAKKSIYARRASQFNIDRTQYT